MPKLTNNGGAVNMLPRTVTIYLVAVLLNYAWEVAQAPLYVGLGSLTKYAVHCMIPSLGDGVIVLAIFGIGWLVLRRPDWSDRPGIAGYAVMLVCGLAIAVAIEWGAVNVLGLWQYKASMPRLPGLGVGFAPVLQMLALPPIVFRVAAWWLSKKQRS